MTLSRQHLNEALFKPLMVAAQGGQPRAAEQLLMHVMPLATAYVRRKIREKADVEDVVQEILLAVHRALHTYEPQRPVMPWLAAVMHYRLMDALRRRYQGMARKMINLSEVEDFLQADVTPDEPDYEYLHKAMQELTQGQQQVIHAMYDKDMSVAETSEALGMSVSSVKVTAHRAYKKLRKQLGQ